MARVVVTGGAGFLGSHLCEALVARGDEVVAVDDLSSGEEANLGGLAGHPRFALVRHDVRAGVPVGGPVDAVAHLASPASPPDYLARPVETLEVGALGTAHALALARAHGARLLLASTSEVYGDPEVHPQPEGYRGNVSPVGPRSVYDEAKRYAEALAMAHHRAHGVPVRIARIFNTYGPRLRPGDGRVVSNLVVQALEGRPLTLYGDGSQTRSFCYVSDLVAGLLALLDSDEVGPVNLGNPHEVSMVELADRVRAVVGSGSPVVFEPLPADDPRRRCPDTALARARLGWAPGVGLDEGLARTADHLRGVLAAR